MTAAVLTPFTTADAVELGNRLWRKQVLPIGNVEYKGRLLHFTKDYLGQLVAAFKSRAYDQVPFQMATDDNAHSNDPERTRGEVTGMELRDDGLYVIAQVTPRGEEVLRENPKLGVSARIVEDYARSDGQRYPAAIQHVLGTLDPRIPGLGAWEAIEAATPVPDEVIDLSSESFISLTGPHGFSHGWIFHGTSDDAPEDKADRMSKNLSRHSFGDGPDGKEAQDAHRQAARAHRDAAKASSSNATVAHHENMARLHSAVASGRMYSSKAEQQMNLANEAPDDDAPAAPEGTDMPADLDGLTDEQKARLTALLGLPDEQLDALAAGGLVLTPDELLALAGSADDAPGSDEDEGTADAPGEDEDDLAMQIAAMTDEEFAAMQAAFDAEQQEEPVAAGLSAEAQFSIDLATARADETARELAVITARMREGDYQAEKRKLADLGVPPYITELARPALEGIGHTIELANGKSVDMGQVMRKVLTEYAQQVKLLDLDVELGSPMDEPEDAVREQVAQGRDDVVSRFKQATGLK